jgi:hypothetical protein
LATTDDARVHYAVLKIRAVPATRHHPSPPGEQFDGKAGPERRTASVPSGPNSVPSPVSCRDHVPSRKRAY